MMKQFVITAITLCCFINIQAQKITCDYDNVSITTLTFCTTSWRIFV